MSEARQPFTISEKEIKIICEIDSKGEWSWGRISGDQKSHFSGDRKSDFSGGQKFQ